MNNQIAKILLATKSVKISTKPPFKYSSGILSPIYCDNRRLISFVEERKQIIEGFKKLMTENDLKPTCLAGTATAGIPWASFLAYELNLPMVYVRSEPKGHGAGKQVEGFVSENAKVLIVEDLISTGGSSINSANAIIKETNSEVVGIVSIMTYDMPKAQKNFADAGLTAYTLTNFASVINSAKEMNYLNEEEFALALEWNKDPDNWGL